jgi:hypothetical protein
MNKRKVVTGQKLFAQLDSITTELSDSEREQERSQRSLMLGALTKYTNSRFHLGRALASYKEACKVDGIWLRASRAIAKHMSISQRTLFRVISDYERVSGAPQAVLSAMQAEGIDPAKRKNDPLLEEITDAMADDPSAEEAQEVVRHSAASLKQRKAQDPMSEDERIIWELRLDIRKRLANIPHNDHKWELLVEAISEESFEVWGDRDPWTSVITPRPGARTLDGRQRQAQEMAA